MKISKDVTGEELDMTDTGHWGTIPSATWYFRWIPGISQTVGLVAVNPTLTYQLFRSGIFMDKNHGDIHNYSLVIFRTIHW